MIHLNNLFSLPLPYPAQRLRSGETVPDIRIPGPLSQLQVCTLHSPDVHCTALLLQGANLIA
jgi:hypothetical protein